MELATGPLPSRPPAAPSAEHGADAWGDFMRRVLVGPTKEARALAVEARPGDAPLRPLAPLTPSTGLAAE